MRRLYCLVGFAVLLGALSPVSATAAERKIEDLADGKIRASAWEGVREAYLPILFPSSHASNLLLLPNGDLLCVWFSGTWEGDSDVAIIMSSLPHGSTQWTKPVVLDHEVGRSFQNPVLFRDPKGRLWLFHTAQLAGKGQANSEVLYLASEDDGKTWTRTKPLFTKPGSYIRHPLVILDKGAWLFPIYYTPSRGITKGAESNYSVIRISKDRGQTWKECEVPDSRGLVQADIVTISEHQLIAFFRSRYADWIYKNTSPDGCAWTSPKPSQLPNNNSSFQVIRLKNGHLVMAFNNSNATDTRGKPTRAPRKPLSVALSVDDGNTWPWVRDVDVGNPRHPSDVSPPDRPGREEYSYPALVQGPDGRIHLTYTYRRETIKYITFDEKWIQQGTTVGKFKGDRPARPATK